MSVRQSALERAFDLASTGRFRIPGEVREALAGEGYSASDLFVLESRLRWAQLRTLCGDARYEQLTSGG